MTDPASQQPTSQNSASQEVTTASQDLSPVEVEGGLSASTDSITELFSREPDSWTESDMVRLVTEMRKRRVELDAAPEKKGRAPAKPPRTDLKGISGAALLAKLSLGSKKE